MLIVAGKEFAADNVIKLSASLAYYTVFAIGPLFLVIISFVGFFFERERVTSNVYNQINQLVGTEGAQAIMNIISRMQEQNDAARFSIIGLVILIFGATTIFADIQDSINYIWSIRAKPKKGWLKFLKNRLLSFSMVVGIGFLLVVSLMINTLTDLMTDRLRELFVNEMVILFKVINFLLLYLVISGLFAVIYKILPDARISWKDAMVGATLTGILFLLGKFLISLYIGSSDMANTYGAAASIIIMLSWVYYSSIILYFGAEFTKVYALSAGSGIKPYDTAVFIIKREARELPETAPVKSKDLLHGVDPDEPEEQDKPAT